MATSLRAGALYFVIVFAAGFVLGPVREFALAPRFGALVALLIEAPLMLAATFLAARWIVGRFALDARTGALRIGACAFAFLAIAEIFGSIALRGLTPAGYAARLATPPGMISLILFAFFALMPWLVVRQRSRTRKGE